LEEEKDAILKYKTNKHQLRTLRENYPKIHLYEKPFIGTEDIRQFCYCKRKIFFRYVLRSPMPLTYKMEYGMLKHEKIQKIKNKADDHVQKYYNVYLSDAELGLVGFLDYFEYDGKEAYPIEIKTGNIPAGELINSHKMQVAAQAMLIEKNFDFLVKKVRIFYTKFQKFTDYSIDIEDKLKVMEIIQEIREIISKERMPIPIDNPAKCRDCECTKYCKRG